MKEAKIYILDIGAFKKSSNEPICFILTIVDEELSKLSCTTTININPGIKNSKR